MRIRIGLVGLVLLALTATWAAAAEPKDTAPAIETKAAAPAAAKDVPGSLALIPKESVAFLHIPSLKTLEDDLARFSKESGIALGRGDHPVLDLLAQRTSIGAGLDADGNATIAFLDPKKYHERYTLYVLPVADWDALLKFAPHEEMAAGLYALTGTVGPRYVARRGRYALVTSSVRTMDAVAAGEPLGSSAGAEALRLATGPGPMVHVNVHHLTTIYTDEIASWFRASSGQVYNQPDALPYTDMLTGYMLGIASFIDQVESLDAAVRFDAGGLAADLSVRFVEGAGVAKFLAAQAPGLPGRPGAAVTPMPAGQPLISSVTLHLDPKERTALILGATQFFLEKAPRPEPLPETTKDQVADAMRLFAESLGPDMTFLSTPAARGQGIATDVTILDLKDAEQFRKGLALVVASWEALADQLNLYLKFETAPEPQEIAGVPVIVYTPRLRFGIPARHLEFRERLRMLYGPEGLVYRVAVVGDKAVIGAGSDTTLMAETIERLKAGKAPEESPALKALEGHLPREQNLALAVNLPLYLAQALERGGTPADKIGTVDPGSTVAGLVVAADGPIARMSSYWPYEQIRLAMDLLKRAAPEISKVPGSLFEPTPEGPPKGGAGAPPPASPPAAPTPAVAKPPNPTPAAP